MEKLKLEHYAPYLPYGLKLNIGQNLNGLWFGNGVLKINGIIDDKIKPILKPLSDLTIKEFDLPRKDYENALYIIKSNDTQAYQNFSYTAILYFCKYHYDFQNLIKRGLATDINTLK